LTSDNNTVESERARERERKRKRESQIGWLTNSDNNTVLIVTRIPSHSFRGCGLLHPLLQRVRNQRRGRNVGPLPQQTLCMYVCMYISVSLLSYVYVYQFTCLLFWYKSTNTDAECTHIRQMAVTKTPRASFLETAGA
jgi:hypothetical protein